MINDKRRSGPRDDNGSCLQCESDLQNASQDVQKFVPAVFINSNHHERKKKLYWNLNAKMSAGNAISADLEMCFCFPCGVLHEADVKQHHGTQVQTR